MQQLDSTILATALPTMAVDFGVTPLHMSVALTSYLLTLAIFIPVSGYVADRFGSRTVFRAAMFVFTLGSVFCALAPNLPLLVAARLLQGVGGAMMMPVGRLIILRSVPRQDMVAAMAWLLVPALIGPILGPPIGGLIVTHTDWRWIFYINVPFGILGIILVSIYIDDVRGEKLGRFDGLGMVLSGVALGSLLFGFEMASRAEETHVALALLLIGTLFAVLYVRHARRHPNPILDLSLWRIPTFRISLIAGSLTRIVQGAQPFLLPMMFQIGFGMSAERSGMIVLASALGALLMKPVAPYVLRRFGFRNCLTANSVLSSAAYLVCAFFTPAWPDWALFAVLLVCGFLMSLQFTAYNTIAYDEINASQMSAAASFYATFQQLTLSLGICAGAIALQVAMLAQNHADPMRSDFSITFVVVCVISVAAALWNIKLSPSAGADISGHMVEAKPPVDKIS